MPTINKTITWATGLSDDGTDPAGVDWSYVRTSTYGGILYDLSYGEFGDQGAFLGFISNNTGTTRVFSAKIYKNLTWEQLGVPSGSFVKSVKATSFFRLNQFVNEGGSIGTGPLEIWDSTDSTFKTKLIDQIVDNNIDWFDGFGIVDYPINEPSSTENVFKIWISGNARRFEVGPGLYLSGLGQSYLDTLSLDISYIDLGACIFPLKIGS